jgi:NTP pyrophosphatase (non-canonical NTP hydrolase)
MKEILEDNTSRYDVNLYQSYIKNLYADINAERDFADVYGYLHRNVGFLCKSIELNKSDQSKFILPISWLFSLATKLNIDVLESFIKKFPGICPYCLENHCVCYKTNKKPLKSMSAYDIEQTMYKMYFKWEEVVHGKEAFGLSKAVDFITAIYPYNEVAWKSASYHAHMLKIHQEMTEIHEAYGYFEKNKKPINAVMDEIADVFAWILSAWAIKYPNESLDSAFTDYYLHDCPVCENAPCHCGLLDSRPATLPDFDKIAQIKDQMNKLSGFFPEQRSEFLDILKSYESVTKTQNMPIAWATLTQTKDFLENLRKKATSIDVEGKSSLTLNSVLRLVNGVLRLEGVQNNVGKYYDVFLSYSTANKDQVRVIYDFLTNKDINVFMCEKKIQPSSNWEEVIKDALKSSRLLCIVASPDSLASEWVKTESDSAWLLETPILPILYHCDPDSLPDRLKRIQAIDYHEYPRIIEVLHDIP